MNEISPELIEKVRSYSLPEEKRDILKSTKTLILAGTSGAGKDTVKHELFKEHADKLHAIITHTTRSPRENNGVMEQNGVEYHFINFDTANKMLDSHEYVEANVFGTNIYGASIDEFERAAREDKIAVIDIDVNGVGAFVAYAKDSVTPIFLLPPNFDEGLVRLKKRYSFTDIDEEDLNERLLIAKEELKHVLGVNYYCFVVNDDLAETVKEVYEIAMHGQTVEANNKARMVAKNILERLEQIT